ncbi:ATP-binding cassette domain-containing protein [Nakamurella silvestris]|nr:ATP-binding cassette domain-containing protein [Nakamurella silvestris]
MIVVEHLTKRFGRVTAVDDLSFQVRPGLVTGFLGPNGAGKSTTMRMILGLDRPTAGRITVNGRRFVDQAAPLHEIGSLLEARAVHPGRSARNHLLALAATTGVPTRRVDEVLDIVGLTSVARQRAGAFSLGMGQRLGIAGALLADPEVVMLDEPANGLDPEGIVWIRELLQGLAREGRTVFVSSHLISEMALTAEHLVIVGRGRLIADLPVSELTGTSDRVTVRSPRAGDLAALLIDRGITVTSVSTDQLEVTGLPVEEIGRRAFDGGIMLHTLTPHSISLEQAFIDLTHDSVQYAPTEVSTRTVAA